MRSKFLYPGAAMLLLSIAFSSCSKTNAVSISDDTKLSFGLQSDNNTYTFATAQTGGPLVLTTANKETFTWDSGTANISRFKLTAKKDGITTEISSGTLTDINLFALGSALASVSVPKGNYTNVKASVIFSQTGGAPFPLVLHGTFTTGAGTHIPVEFDFNDDLEVIATVNDMLVDGSVNYINRINLHLNQFLTSIAASEVDAATRNNGTIIISKTVNVTLYNKMRGNLLVCAASVFSTFPKK
jgi:hypothetical protein